MVTFLVEQGASVNQPDNEGWIPLHAAASCGYLDIAEYLISQGANVGVVNSEGETPLDIAEEEPMEELLQNEINRQGLDIEAARKEEERIMLRDARQWLNSGQIQDTRHAKSGGTALHVAAAKGYVEVLNKETLLLEPEKTAPCIETLEPEKVDEEEEGKKDESSSAVTSSTTTTPAAVSVSSPSSPTNQVTTPTSPVKKVVQPAGKVSTKVEEERKDESPASWRLGLRKTGSYGALSEITATKEAQREKDTTGVMRSASSPRLSSSLDNKEKEKVSSDNTSHTLALGRSGSTRDVPAKSSSTSSLDPNTCNTKPWQPPTSHYPSYSIYRRSYLTPVRDEESESQRKARSRQARQSRRSTQGVTLTDLQEAEKTIGRSRPQNTREEEKEKQDKEKQEEKTETREDDYRSKYRSFEEGDENDPEQQSDSEDGSTRGESQVTNLTHTLMAASTNLSLNESTSYLDRNDALFSRSYGESRRPYSSRLDRDDTTDYKKLYEQILAENEKLKAQLRDTDLELADLKLQLEKATQVCTRPLFIIKHVFWMSSKLYDVFLMQRQERYADRSQLEMEKRVMNFFTKQPPLLHNQKLIPVSCVSQTNFCQMRSVLNIPVTLLMGLCLKNLPQVKQVQALRQVKERLQAENRALARVVAKLSQSACSQLPASDL
ncbi:hypothetical protein GOODEAATRI_006980 [Goodea atripinnis]|uniref:Protein phosphatase 1 regulatory subunit 12A n=1 Tax=Goodea atripinnis TaxID=208336 RepID=A0ABV0N2H9_9TELE